MARLRLAAVAHRYAGSRDRLSDHALKPLDLSWEHGLTHALLGPSGCGKTTLLNILSGLLRPTAGRVFFDDDDVTDTPTRARNVAQVFQFPVVYDTLSVFDNLAFPLRNRKLAADAVRRRVDQVGRLLELDDVFSRRAGGLDVGARQRLALGRGLVREDVAAVLLDEPLTVIDPGARWELRRRLRLVHQELQPTMIHVTHDQDEALTIADRVVVMDAGRVVQVGTPAQLFEWPAHVFVAGFLGSPGMNLVPCRLEGECALVEKQRVPLDADLVRSARRALTAGVGGPGADSPDDGSPGVGGSEGVGPGMEGVSPAQRSAHDSGLVLGVRPERLRWAPPGADGVDVTVRRIDDLGSRRVVLLELGPHTLRLDAGEQACPAPGSRVRVRLPAADVRLFLDGHALGALAAADTPSAADP